MTPAPETASAPVPASGESVYFFVPGSPEPMPRIKAALAWLGKKPYARVYTPDGDWSTWKVLVARCAPKPTRPRYDGPVGLVLEFVMPAPASLAKRDRGAYCAVKPDFDNLEKLVADALKERGYFYDDGRVVESATRKRYAEPNESPGLFVWVCYLPLRARPRSALASCHTFALIDNEPGS